MQALINIAVEELCETANSLLAPVRHGVVRPTAPFNLTSTSDFVAVEELFSVEPLAPRSGHQLNYTLLASHNLKGWCEKVC